MEKIARSLVDDRQPYFIENGRVITIKERIKQLKKAHVTKDEFCLVCNAKLISNDELYGGMCYKCQNN